MSEPPGKVLFDFTSHSTSVDHWVEQSDVVRSVGMSKATLVLQKTQQFQRAVFFTLLNPQPNGAGFAGMRIFTSLDLSDKSKLVMSCRGQGQNYDYKVVLRHRGLDEEPNPTYELTFQVRYTANQFSLVMFEETDKLPTKKCLVDSMSIRRK